VCKRERIGRERGVKEREREDWKRERERERKERQKKRRDSKESRAFVLLIDFARHAVVSQ
jgi:hypothetical protein